MNAKASQIAKTNELDYGGNAPVAAGIVFQTVRLDFTVPEMPEAKFDPESGELVIYDTNNEPHVIAEQQNDGKSIFPMTIEDDQGNQYLVSAEIDDDGNVGEVTVEKTERVIASEGAFTSTNGGGNVDPEKAAKKVEDMVIVLQKRIREYLKNENDKYPKLAFQNEYILPSITEFSADMTIGGGYTNGRIYVGMQNFVENRSDDDILSTIYHEYMHYLNWHFGETYILDEKGGIYKEYIDCFEERLQDEIEFFISAYKKYLWYKSNPPLGVMPDYNLPSSYKDMSLEQEIEFDKYLKEENLKPKVTCIPFDYQPSNYFKDEINAYGETLKAQNKGLFELSTKKNIEYEESIESYTRGYEKAKRHEANRNLNGRGDEK